MRKRCLRLTPAALLLAAGCAGGGLRFHGTSDQGVWCATSPDGSAWSPPFFVGIQGGDPAVVEAGPGRWLMVVTGADRPPGT